MAEHHALPSFPGASLSGMGRREHLPASATYAWGRALRQG